jgi:hypothetical protein
MIEALQVGKLYANDEIFGSLKVSNAGGIRLGLQGGAVLRAAIFTSVRSFHSAGENPYHDSLEEGILTYTAAGKFGQQTLSGANSRLIEQKLFNFPIHGFALVASRRDRSVGPRRWRYLGLLEYLRHYQQETTHERDERFRNRARELYHEEGQIEVDADACVSVADGGAYVAAWVWVPLEKQQSEG